MNESIIMGMVAPYLKGDALTYREFERIFSMLSLQEQYGVLEILDKNNIELVESHNATEKTDQPKEESIEKDKFELLYDDDLFSDASTDPKTSKTKADESETQYTIVRKKVHLSTRTLIKMIQDGDAQAKQDLCVANHGLVDKWVNVYQHVFGNKMDFEDLEQAGMLGMIKAAEKFDLNMGTEFSTYASWWIKQAITREIQDNGYTIRIPVHRMEQIQKVMRLDSKYAAEADYQKRIKLISDETRMPVALVEDCMRLFYQFVRTTSLDLPIGEDEDTPLGELVQQEDEISIEDTVAAKLLREQLEEALDTLTDREQKVLRLRFGLLDGRARTLEEVGREFNVTRERIRQIEAKALRKLRHPSRSRKLKDYLD
mgnify:CR=1 FL=1